MRIGLFCSGGDAPGMNACSRAVVRAAIGRGYEVIGINRGYHGVIHEDFYIDRDGSQLMDLRSVSNWGMHGGAILRSSRSEEFRSESGQNKAAEILRKHQIDALIPIGGDGTFKGAIELARQWSGQIVGCPGTIDNDLFGTDYTIGFSTAVQTAVEAVDKIRDTAESHERMFLIEVMGRHSGYIAICTALASGAEVVAIPETPTDISQIVEYLKVLHARKKSSIMMVVAEGDEQGDAFEIDQKLKTAGNPFKTRVVVLGHIQRGGRPTPEDRIRSTMMGSAAVRAVADGKTGIMIGTNGEEICETPFATAVSTKRQIPVQLVRLVEEMAK
jgi:6-phosphofructokinase 1